MRATEFLEGMFGVNAKRPSREGSRPERGHEPQKRYVTDRKTGKEYDPEEEFDKLKNSDDFKAQMKRMATKEGKTQRAEPSKPRNFVAKNAIQSGAGAHKDKKKAEKQGDVKHKKRDIEMSEHGPASRKLCLSTVSDKDLGASALASCKSQGLRARTGNKSHLIGHGDSKVRVVVGGKKIKGKEHGGPLPDYGTRKDQR